MPFLPKVGQAPREPVVPVGLSQPWCVALVPYSARSQGRLGGRLCFHSTLNEVLEEKLGFLFLLNNDGSNPSPEVSVKGIQSPLAFIGAELKVAAPAFKVSVGLLEAGL